MTKLIVTGHGGYAGAMKRHLDMLIGSPDAYFFVDFNEGESADEYRKKLNETIAAAGENEILFACDMIGGTPFREAQCFCGSHKNCAVVAGLNPSAYSEMAFNLKMSPQKLANFGAEITKSSIAVFPSQE